MRSFLRLPMAPTRPMAEPTTAEWACIVVPTTAEGAFIGVPIIVVRPIGMMVPGMPMARGAAQPVGTTAREAREDGGEAPLPGIMDRGVSAVSAVARLRGVVAPAAQRDGGAARPHGAAVPAPSMELAVARFHGDGEADPHSYFNHLSRHPLPSWRNVLPEAVLTGLGGRRSQAGGPSISSGGCFEFLLGITGGPLRG
jgi:hypothetical protein